MMLTLSPQRTEGLLPLEAHEPVIPGALWFEATEPGAALSYSFPAGELAAYRYLTSDLLLDGNELAVLAVILSEGEDGPALRFSFGLLNQCQARMRMPLAAADQNRWLFEREGAWLKPSCWGDRVDLARVDRMRLALLRKGSSPVRFCLTPIDAVTEEPPLLARPILPRGALIDGTGQSTLRDWPGKSRDAAEVTARLRAQLGAAPGRRLPEGLSRWGGSMASRFRGSGFFRVERDERRWWLVDPDGYPFWSAGVDCVRVDTAAACRGLEAALLSAPQQHAEPLLPGGSPHINYLEANLARAYGDGWREKWAEVALAELRRIGFNTVGNWSEWEIARKRGVPYVRPLHPSYRDLPVVYRDFPDVFHPGFKRAAAAYARQLRDTRDDPALIGYFLMNEPTWGFADETPAAGMLYTTASCHARRALARHLRKRHRTDDALAAAWGMPVSFRSVEKGAWRDPLTAAARQELAGFSAVMVVRLFQGLSRACRTVDPNHLNLGVRYYTQPPEWAMDGMRAFDVFSMNCYHSRLPAEEMGRSSAALGLPIMIGEWHFGALDAGLQGSGIGRVATQADRGRAYRLYLEQAAAQTWCIGVHYFTLYDQSALGRFDGECYNIGFLDVCNRPYDELCDAARASHERLYSVGRGEVPPYDEEPEYLPALYL